MGSAQICLLRTRSELGETWTGKDARPLFHSVAISESFRSPMESGIKDLSLERQWHSLSQLLALLESAP
jgi:hypothetical protein